MIAIQFNDGCHVNLIHYVENLISHMTPHIRGDYVVNGIRMSCGKNYVALYFSVNRDKGNFREGKLQCIIIVNTSFDLAYWQ